LRAPILHADKEGKQGLYQWRRIQLRVQKRCEEHMFSKQSAQKCAHRRSRRAKPSSATLTQQNRNSAAKPFSKNIALCGSKRAKGRGPQGRVSASLFLTLLKSGSNLSPAAPPNAACVAVPAASSRPTPPRAQPAAPTPSDLVTSKPLAFRTASACCSARILSLTSVANRSAEFQTVTSNSRASV
jgi:hypothetical protein